MPEPEREVEPEQTTAQAAGFGAAPEKAVPVNAPDAAKGQKRGRDEEEEEEEEEDAEMEMDSDSD
jgi:U2 small nuclear ribonucleoprotein B''